MDFPLRVPAMLVPTLLLLGCASVSRVSDSSCEPRKILINVEASGTEATHFHHLLERELVKRGFSVSAQPEEGAAILLVVLSTHLRVSASHAEGYTGAGGTFSGSGSGGVHSWVDAWVTAALQSTDGRPIWSHHFEPRIFDIGERLAQSTGSTLSSRASHVANGLAKACVNNWDDDKES